MKSHTTSDFIRDTGSVPARVSLHRALKFVRDESGVMIAFSVFFFLIILILAGIGVDFMHFEMKRTRLQNTLDRAVLAAADLQQPLDASAVVQDYIDKAGLDATLTSAPQVNSGLNFKDVYADAQLNVPTQFIHMLGINELTAPASAAAKEAIEGIEVVMVLDVSGSMGWDNKLVNLKPAAREFVDTVLGLAPTGKVTISIVPYNTQVNAGADLLSHYNVSTEQTYSNCVNFAASDYDSAALSTAQPLERTMHFDIWTDQERAFPPQATAASGGLTYPICPTTDFSEIMVMSNNALQLHTKINAFQASGNTSIDIGMKWASTLLDPGTRPVITSMIGTGDVAAANAGRPVSYDEPDVLKVIVVMTDGQNTEQWKLRSDRRSGDSDVYYNAAADRYSIRIGSSPNEYYWVGDNSWNDHAYGDGPAETGSAQRLTYPELFAFNTLQWNRDNNFLPAYQSLYGSAGTAMADAEWYDDIIEYEHRTQKDIRLQAICDQAKANEVMIYSIGFEALPNGETQMRNCASTPSHFFDVDGVEITSAFQAIAASIAQLRLTQ
jgi:Flp pilus assembly protein TadG